MNLGMDWDGLAALSPEEIGDKDAFPYKALPHPVQGGGHAPIAIACKLLSQLLQRLTDSLLISWRRGRRRGPLLRIIPGAIDVQHLTHMAH